MYTEEAIEEEYNLLLQSGKLQVIVKHSSTNYLVQGIATIFSPQLPRPNFFGSNMSDEEYMLAVRKISFAGLLTYLGKPKRFAPSDIEPRRHAALAASSLACLDLNDEFANQGRLVFFSLTLLNNEVLVVRPGGTNMQLHRPRETHHIQHTYLLLVLE